MKFLAPSALVLAVVAWAFTVYITAVMLSGTPIAERSCQTGCVQVLFFSGLGLGAVALILSGLAVLRYRRARLLSILSLLLGGSVFAVLAGVMLIGILA